VPAFVYRPDASVFSFSVYATQGLHGLVYGMLLFLVASALTLVFGMMGIQNIARPGASGRPSSTTRR
jgi:hypothetical protein